MLAVETTTHYKYRLFHPVADESIDITIYDENARARWEPYLLHFSQWLQEQREKRNQPV